MLELSLDLVASEIWLMEEVALGNLDWNYPDGRVEMQAMLVRYFALIVFATMVEKNNPAEGSS